MKEAKPVCQHCEQPLTPSGGPAEWCWSVPFTKIEIRIWNWAKQELQCVPCLIEKDQDKGRGAYEAGQEDGYRLGFQDGQRSA